MISGGMSTSGTKLAKAMAMPASVISTGAGRPSRSPNGTVTTAPRRSRSRSAIWSTSYLPQRAGPGPVDQPVRAPACHAGPADLWRPPGGPGSERAAHGPVRHPGVRELGAVRRVAEPFVEAERLCLGVQVDGGQAQGAGLVLDGADQGRSDAQTAGLTRHGEPAERPDGVVTAGLPGRRLTVQQPSRAERGAVRGHGEDVHRRGVVGVVLDVLGHLLLADEDVLADLEAGGEVALVEGPARAVRGGRGGHWLSAAMVSSAWRRSSG